MQTASSHLTPLALVAGDLEVFQPIQPGCMGSRLRQLLAGFPHRLVNLEAPLLPDEPPHPRPKAGPSVYQHSGAMSFFSADGFTHAYLGNNHIFDYGESGLAHTLARLQAEGIPCCGAALNPEAAYAPVSLNAAGRTIQFFSACESSFGAISAPEHRSGYAWLFSPVLYQNIRAAKAQGCLVVVLAHAGLEMADLPLPEWQQHYRYLADLGADAVLASHPHVVQGTEYYKGKPIVYSLGNFFFNMPYPDTRWHTGMLAGLYLAPDNRLEVHTWFTSFGSGEVELLADDTQMRAHYSALCRLLEPDNTGDYIQKANQQAVQFWESSIRDLYALQPFKSIQGGKEKLLQRLINAAKYLLFPQEKFSSRNNLYLLSITGSETIRYLLLRALRAKENVY